MIDALLIGIALAALSTAPPPQAPSQLTIERIFASPALSGPSPRDVQLSPDGRYATLLKPRADDARRYDLWAINVATGQQRMLVDSTKLGSGDALSEAERMRRERLRIGGDEGIVEYRWAPDSRSIVVPLDGDVYLAQLDGNVRRLTNTPDSELDPQVSEDGRYVSFVRGQNLHAIELASGHETALTRQGGGTVTCGTADFIAEEEMTRYTGTWWAPGDRRVAVECYDEAKVPTVTRSAIGADGTSTYVQHYPAAGTTNAAVTLWLIDPDGDVPTRVDLGANPDFYLARAMWAPDGGTLYVERESRDQKRLDLLAVDPASGASHVVLSETAKTWVTINDDFQPLSDGSLIWGSARSGYTHLYRVDHGRVTQLTHGDWTLEENGQTDRTGLIGVDEAHHRLFFEANKDTPLESQIYTIDYRHPGEPRRLTEAGFWNEASMDRGGTRLLVTRSSPTQPPQVYLADASGKRLAWVEQNRLDASHPYAPYLAAQRPVQYGTLKAADGRTLQYEMITPPLLPGKRYPVYFYHYGGPGEQVVTHAWLNPIDQYWVSKGWIYFAIDNRGSPNRGRAFEDQIYHALGGVEVQDQAVGARWLQQQPFVDPTRIAVVGASYGGYMTLKMLEQAPRGLYAAGVAIAPVTKWELYDTHYTERFLGRPQDNPAVYARADALDQATGITTPFLLIHGMSDDNVEFQNSAMLINELQATDTPFDMALYVGQTHTISGPNRRADVYHVVERYLDRTVLGEASASWTPVQAPRAAEQ